jgi:hypothetical protein
LYPPLQMWLDPLLPQPPQLLLSVLVFTQLPLQPVWPGEQQTPLELDVPPAQQRPPEQLLDEHELLLLTGHEVPLGIFPAQLVPLQYEVELSQQVVPHVV